MNGRKTKGKMRGYKDIAAEMRRRILSGKWCPGTRIPTKIELCKEFETSVGTMQRALNALNGDGFLKPRGCAGTFIREDAPHLHRIGVVFPGDPTFSLLWHAVDREVRRLELIGSTHVRTYCNCAAEGNESELPELLDDVDCGRVGALLFVGPPTFLEHSDVLTNPRLVRATIGTRLPAQKLSDIEVRMTPEEHTVMEYLQGAGHKRIALLCTYSWGNNIGGMRETAADYGLQTERRLIHRIDQRSPYTCRSIAELLMGLPTCERPDALYIVDDHLVPQTTMGIHDAGVRSGAEADVEIVAHANFPYPQHTAVPVTFIGYDIRALLDQTIRAVKQRIDGEQTETVIAIDPVFQSDLPYDLWDSPAQTPQARQQFECMAG